MFKFFKIPLILILVAAFAFSPALYPHTARAGDLALVLKEFALDTVARVVTNLMYTFMANMILDKLQNGGRSGDNATFVQNWRNFLNEAEYRGEDTFKAIVGKTKLCEDIEESINSSFRVSPEFKNVSLQDQRLRVGAMDPFTLRARCSMPEGFSMTDYALDPVANGGWAALERLILDPQNNRIGATIMAFNEMEGQSDLEQKSDENEATGTGFTGSRPDNAQCENGAGARCVTLKDIKSPGSYLGDVASQLIEKKFEFIVNSDEITEAAVQFILQQLIEAAGEQLTNLAESGREEFASRDTLEQQKTEYCTAKKPRPAIRNGPPDLPPGELPFRQRFDLVPWADNPCGKADEDNLAEYRVCVEACLKALGVIPDDVPVDPPPPQPPPAP